MAMDVDVVGGVSGRKAEVDVNSNLQVALSLIAASIGGVRNFSENDAGKATGIPYLLSPEVDDDFRMRVSNDIVLDEEDLTYTAQNFTKHRLDLTTFTGGFTTAGFNTNSGNTFATGSATALRTYKTFSMEGTETLSLDLEGSINYASGAAVPANQTLEFGFGLLATTTPFDCFDGVYYRANSSGVYGVLRNNSITDVAVSTAFNDYTGVPWIPVSGRKYQFICYLMTRSAEFWVNDPVTDNIWLAAEVAVPAGYGAPIASQATNVFTRQYVSGTSTVAASFTLARYNVRRGGTNISTTLNVLSARSGESILSPGTLTTSANQTVTTGSIVRPAAGVPSNTTALVTSLSGIVLETPTGAAAVDTILMAYQNPALPTAVGATYAPNRRLRIDAINIASAVQTALTGGGIAKMFYLAYGSTSVSLAGVAADTVSTKAYRRVQLPIVQAYAAAQAAGTIPSGNANINYVLQTPVFINPGEFVALVCTNLIGTAVTAGTLQHAISFDYAWE
jgi:hypothetical protein